MTSQSFDRPTELMAARVSRRTVVRASATGMAAGLASTNAFAQDATPAERLPLTPDEALNILLEGNEAFLDDTISPPDNSDVRAASIEEHRPIAAILGCADARVAAETVFFQKPGDLFMVRFAGNVISDFGLASLEFAVGPLNTPVLMVLGHSKCGAVAGTIEVVNSGAVLPGRLPALADALEPSVLRALETHPDDPLDAAIEENVRRQVDRLHTISPVIASALEAGTVQIVGAVYDLATGKVNLIDQ